MWHPMPPASVRPWPACPRAGAFLLCLCLSPLLPGATYGQGGERLQRYAGLGVGWTRAFGRVSSMTDLVHFTSPVAADELYEPGVAVHLAAGRRVRAWLLELTLDARIPRLTEAGQAIVNQTHPSGGEVDVAYATFELLVGRAVPSGRLSPFGGVGLGLAIMQFSSGSSVQPHNARPRDAALLIPAAAGAPG
jgi:hypothetical protein